MIVSASRRSDIPAFYSPWLLNRLRAGRVFVRNPFNRCQIADIRLDPSLVECIVLWSKNPAPLLPSLQEITSRGYPLALQYTITGCDQQLEPEVAGLAQRITTFEKLAHCLGPDRVLWRFDPIVLTNTLGLDHYIERFSLLCHALHGLTHQCSISFLSLYAKCRRNLAGINLVDPGEQLRKELARQLNSIARQYGISLKACSDEFLSDACGLERAHCIDASQLGAMLGFPLEAKKDPGQRPGCGCTMSIDIGAYDSCPHGCRYCYANTNHRVALRNYASHDPDSPLLIGRLHGDETIRRREMVSLRTKQTSLFAPLPREKESPSPEGRHGEGREP